MQTNKEQINKIFSDKKKEFDEISAAVKAQLTSRGSLKREELKAIKESKLSPKGKAGNLKKENSNVGKVGIKEIYELFKQERDKIAKPVSRVKHIKLQK